MTNKPALHRTARDRAVADLLAVRAEHGSLTRTHFRMAAHDVEYSERQLRRQVADHDKAHGDAPTSTEFVVDADVIEMVMRTCGNLANAHRRLDALGKPLPSLSTFKRKVRHAMGGVQLAYAKNASTAARRSRVYLKRTPENRGYTYFLDHTELPIYVIPNGYMTATRPWMTAVMDAETRYLLSWVITFGTPTAEEIRAALISAITQRVALDDTTIVGGAPERCQWDRGLDFLSDLVTESCLRLGIMPVALPGYHPHLKGPLERWWRFLKENCIATLPGYTDAGEDLRGNLLHASAALSQTGFLTEVSNWIDFYNTRHQHRILGCTPLQAWARDTTPLRNIPADQLWQDFLLSKEKVKVGLAGVHFAGQDFVPPTKKGLDKVFGLYVEVRYLPHDRTFIEVFYDGQHVTTCVDVRLLRPDEEQSFIQTRKEDEANARKSFTTSNRLRAAHPDAQPIKKVTGKNRKTHYAVTPPPELDLFAGADEALAKFENLPDDGQGRLL